VENERLPELCGGRKSQGCGSDPDDRHVMAVERRCRVHDVRTTAESTSPQAVREHDLTAVTLSVAFRQRATECHRDAQQFEVIPRDSRALEPFRLAEASHVDGGWHHGGCPGKGIASAHVVANIQWGEPWRHASLVSVKEHYQATRITIGQLSNQHAVHDRKHRRLRAYA